MSLELEIMSEIEKKDIVIRNLLQENFLLKDQNSGLQTKLAMCNSYLVQALQSVENLKVVFQLIKSDEVA